MAERFLDCRNLTAYFYKSWQTTLGEAQDASDSNQRESANREANGFKRAYFTALKWLYEHTDVPETNIHALIEKKYGGSSIPIAPARRALEALDEQGDNLKLLAFMWEHYPAQCKAIELPRPAKRKQRANGAQGTPERKRRGRTKADCNSVQQEAKLAAKWNQAREAGTFKTDFARDNQRELKALDAKYPRQRKTATATLDALLDRVASRNRRSEN